jgi:hypothetical protein
MEFFLVMISVPLFLIILLVFALFVLPRYPRRAPAHATPPAVNTPGAQGSPPVGNAPGTNSDPMNMSDWG